VGKLVVNFHNNWYQSQGCREMQSLKFGIERFDGKINFGLWQIQVKDILIQSGLHKILGLYPPLVLVMILENPVLVK
jgi:hypothetical protein